MGCPCRSNIANMKNGSMITIMSVAAMLTPMDSLVRKNKGTPTSAPRPKQITCRLVRFKMNLDLTFVRSLGTGTYAMLFLLSDSGGSCGSDPDGM